jgi:hypothetical protein
VASSEFLDVKLWLTVGGVQLEGLTLILTAVDLKQRIDENIRHIITMNSP